MKHIIFSNYDDLNNPYYGGGGARAIHEVAKRLTNVKVMVITGKYPYSKNETIENVRYKRIGISFGGPKLGQIIFQFLLPFYGITLKYDIWIENFTPPFSTSFLPIFTNRPVIGLVHMLIGEDMERKYKLPFKKLENMGLKFYRTFIVTSADVKKKIRKSNKNAQIEVIPNGVDMPNNKPVKGEHILFLGRVEVNQKGIDLLLKAYANIKEEMTYPLIIAGSGEEKQLRLVRKLIKMNALDSKVILAGRVEGLEKETLLKKANCLVVPSRYETFSLTSLEGMAYGIPLITFDIDGLEWIGRKGRIAVEKFNVSKLAKTILTFSKDSKLKGQVGKEGRVIAAQYSWEKTGIQYQKLLMTV